MSKLDLLIEAVDSGSIATISAADIKDGTGKNCQLLFISAFRGSLDAAAKLHEALLPGWVAKPEIGGSGAGVKYWHCTVVDWDSREEVEAYNMPCPARAWLLAILRAYRDSNQAEGAR